MTATPSALLSHRGIDAVGTAARRRQIKADEAEQDRGGAVVDQREEPARKMADEIGKRHFARQDESGKTREQADHQQRAEDQFDRAGRANQRKQLDLVERHAGRKFQDFGEAVLQEQQPGNEAKQTKRDRLKFRKRLVHVIAPCFDTLQCLECCSARKRLRPLHPTPTRETYSAAAQKKSRAWGAALLTGKNAGRSGLAKNQRHSTLVIS